MSHKMMAKTAAITVTKNSKQHTIQLSHKSTYAEQQITVHEISMPNAEKCQQLPHDTLCADCGLPKTNTLLLMYWPVSPTGTAMFATYTSTWLGRNLERIVVILHEEMDWCMHLIPLHVNTTRELPKMDWKIAIGTKGKWKKPLNDPQHTAEHRTLGKYKSTQRLHRMTTSLQLDIACSFVVKTVSQMGNI